LSEIVDCRVRASRRPFLGGVSKELRSSFFCPNTSTARPTSQPAQGLDQCAADVVVREERKAGDYRAE
jgi:hypothetical protein